ncbi:TRAP transporter substrate-binding protein [Salinicoccus hispanicus]|uniref:DctP family TRAP transporter solute-binding subunit n=1 Tax=Salinicoccus hispanicus TaxID=157225 RepID=A0A6N8U6P5_9STAP|nr:TRAP transporter substrate-binding protein [Salinicoccus hispanicus]MXQ51299.1 DctP family TRAP transporter solute-binding subunit [Salinicoccus hispanicus]
MKKLLLLLVLMIGVLAACGGGNEDEADTGEDSNEVEGSEGGTISFSTWANEGEAAYVGMERFKEIVEEETGGNYTVDLFPGNQLGSTAEQMEQVKMGSIELMSSGDPGMIEIEMLSLPYLMESNEHWANVLESDIGDEWNETLKEDQGIINIGTLPRGPRVISSNTEINEPADMQGLKFRTPERDYYVQTFEALGASPTPIDFGELYSALETGIVDGQENPLETIVAGGFMEVQSDVSLTNHMYKPAFITVNDEFFEGLTEEEQQIFRDASQEANEVASEQLQSEEEQMMSDLEEQEVTITEPNVDAFKEATQSVRDNLGTDTWGEERYNRIVEMGQEDLNE